MNHTPNPFSRSLNISEEELNMKPKHTPTPWRVLDFRPSIDQLVIACGEDVSANTPVICRIKNEVKNSKIDCFDEANAALIVKAVNNHHEAIELLQDIANHLSGGAALYEGSLIFKEDAPAIDVINAFLKKVKE